MGIDLVFESSRFPKDKTYRAAMVIDVLRATSVMATLLGAGAPAVLLARNIEEAKVLKKRLGAGWFTSGARYGKRIDGFDYGNAMLEFIEKRLDEENFILSTTNGTGAIYKTWPLAERVFVASLLNASAAAQSVVDLFEEEEDIDVLLVLSGVRGQYSIDDAITAGVLLDKMLALGLHVPLSDEARTCLLAARGAEDLGEELRQSRTGKALAKVGLIDEVEYTLRLDEFDFAIEVREETELDLDPVLSLHPRRIKAPTKHVF